MLAVSNGCEGSERISFETAAGLSICPKVSLVGADVEGQAVLAAPVGFGKVCALTVSDETAVGIDELDVLHGKQ
jgi:hypothetical protein